MSIIEKARRELVGRHPTRPAVYEALDYAEKLEVEVKRLQIALSDSYGKFNVYNKVCGERDAARARADKQEQYAKENAAKMNQFQAELRAARARIEELEAQNDSPHWPHDVINKANARIATLEAALEKVTGYIGGACDDFDKQIYEARAALSEEKPVTQKRNRCEVMNAQGTAYCYEPTPCKFHSEEKPKFELYCGHTPRGLDGSNCIQCREEKPNEHERPKSPKPEEKPKHQCRHPNADGSPCDVCSDPFPDPTEEHLAARAQEEKPKECEHEYTDDNALCEACGIDPAEPAAHVRVRVGFPPLTPEQQDENLAHNLNSAEPTPTTETQWDADVARLQTQANRAEAENADLRVQLAESEYKLKGVLSAQEGLQALLAEANERAELNYRGSQDFLKQVVSWRWAHDKLAEDLAAAQKERDEALAWKGMAFETERSANARAEKAEKARERCEQEHIELGERLQQSRDGHSYWQGVAEKAIALLREWRGAWMDDGNGWDLPEFEGDFVDHTDAFLEEQE